jgi:acyl carrier protein
MCLQGFLNFLLFVTENRHVPQVHYSHNDVAVYARFCYSLGGSFRSYFRRICEPQGETESKLAKIWEKLLGTRQVGRHDNFFELGGHSLSVIQLTVEIQRSFGINISLRDLFMSPTLAGWRQ